MSNLLINIRTLFRRWNLFRPTKHHAPAEAGSIPTPIEDNRHKPPAGCCAPVACQQHICPDTATRANGKPLLNGKAKDDRMAVELSAYLNIQHNQPVDIEKLHQILKMQHIIIEIGCGTCEVALEIALQNPESGVIATDAYAWGISIPEGSYYQKVARQWKGKQLQAQQNTPPNLVILRADTDILRFIPDQRIDSILLINPETSVGQDVLHLLSDHPVYNRIKNSHRQLVILPFSREMGMVACGGNEFEHAEDWSKGLGFMMDSRFRFKKVDMVQWGVDLRNFSPYSQNSTQQDVFLFGNRR